MKDLRIGKQAALLPLSTSKILVMALGIHSHERSSDLTWWAVVVLVIAIAPVMIPMPIGQYSAILAFLRILRLWRRTMGKAAQMKSVRKEKTG